MYKYHSRFVLYILLPTVFYPSTVYRVSCTESYFLAELLYAPEDDLVNKKLLTLHIITISTGMHAPTNVVGNSVLDDHSQDSQEPAINKTHAANLIDDGGDKDWNKANSSCSATNLRSKFSGTESGSYILDIDLDFFSTGNPFVDVYSKEEYSSVRKLYAYTRPVDSSLEVSVPAPNQICLHVSVF